MDVCETTYTGRINLSTTQSHTIAAILIVLIPTTIATNLLVVISLIKTKQLRNTCNVLYLFLSTSDCCAGIVNIPQITLLFIYFKKSKNCQIELSSMFSAELFGHVSAYMVVLLSVYRFIFINPNLNNLKLRAKEFMESKKGIIALITFGVFFSTIYAVILCVTSKTSYFYLVNFIIAMLDFVMLFLAYILYLVAYLRVRCHVKRGQSINIANPAYLLRMTKTIFLILSTIGVCYFPFIAFQMVLFVKKDVTKTELNSTQLFVLFLAHCLVILNSVLNAIIIMCRNEDVNKWVCVNIFRVSLEPSNNMNGPHKSTENNAIPMQSGNIVITNTNFQ